METALKYLLNVMASSITGRARQQELHVQYVLYIFSFWVREDGGGEREILDFAHELLASTADSECAW